MSALSLCRSPQTWPLVSGAGWRVGAAMLAMGLLPPALAQVDPATPARIPHPDSARDPRWIERLPPATLPLPRLGASSSGQSADKSPLVAQDAPGSSVPASAPHSAAPAMADREEATEDSSRVEVLERQVISASGEDKPLPAKAVTPISGPAEEGVVVHRPAAMSPKPEPAPAPASVGGVAPAPSVAAQPSPVPAQSRSPAPVPAPATAGVPMRVVPIAPAPTLPPTAFGYRWQAQLLAGRSLDRVREDWRIFVSRHRAILEGLTLAISQSHFGDARDAFYRLRVLEWTDKADADRWCARVRATGAQCLVTRVTALPAQ